MRVVLVVHQFFPSFSAGTEVLTLGVARELRARGHIVHIVAGHPGQSDMNDSERWVRDHFDGFDVDRFHHADVPMHGQRSIIEVGSDNALAAQGSLVCCMNFGLITSTIFILVAWEQALSLQPMMREYASLLHRRTFGLFVRLRNSAFPMVIFAAGRAKMRATVSNTMVNCLRVP